MAVYHHHHSDSAAVANSLYIQFVIDQLTSVAPQQASEPDAYNLAEDLDAWFFPHISPHKTTLIG